MATKKNTDTVPAMLTPGEFVIKRDSAKKIGYDLLELMNETGKVPSMKQSGGNMAGQSYLKSKFLNGMMQGYAKGGKAKKSKKASAMDSLLEQILSIHGPSEGTFDPNSGRLMQSAYDSQAMAEEIMQARALNELQKKQFPYGGDVLYGESPYSPDTIGRPMPEPSRTQFVGQTQAPASQMDPRMGHYQEGGSVDSDAGRVDIRDIIEVIGPGLEKAPGEDPRLFDPREDKKRLVQGLLDYITDPYYDNKSGTIKVPKKNLDTLNTFGEKSEFF